MRGVWKHWSKIHKIKTNTIENYTMAGRGVSQEPLRTILKGSCYSFFHTPLIYNHVFDSFVYTPLIYNRVSDSCFNTPLIYNLFFLWSKCAPLNNEDDRLPKCEIMTFWNTFLSYLYRCSRLHILINEKINYRPSLCTNINRKLNYRREGC